MRGAPTPTLPCKRERESAVSGGRVGAATSVQPQIGDVLRVGLQFADFHPPDDVGQDRVGRSRDADLLALPDDEAVEERDLRAAALDHVLTGRRAMLAAAAV